MLTQPAARALGGTSTINGLTYSRGSSSLYDNWQALGNANWSWSGVFPYFQKVWCYVHACTFVRTV